MVFAFVRVAAVSAVLLPAAAFAASPGQTTADLNVRQGPGSNYPIVATVPAGTEVTISGCIADSAWCMVDYGGREGYAYGRYLTASDNGTAVTVTERPGLVGLITAPVNIAAGATGAIVGTLTGGDTARGEPGTTSSSFQSPPNVIAYVRNNPPSGDPVYLDGEAVPGAVVPAAVVLRDVPDTDYQYANINGESVIVSKGTRQVVYVVR